MSKREQTYCNPLPLPSYPRGRACAAEGFEGADFREMAVPTVLHFEGRWYLFPSAGMLWHSDDLVRWTHYPIQPYDAGYTPTVVAHRGWLYLTASWDDSAMWRAHHPFGPWERIGVPGHDADGADRSPWKLTDRDGLCVVRLRDEEPFRFAGAPCVVLAPDPARRPWAGVGEYNQRMDRLLLEGAWVNKIDGRYCLQCSSNGTEFRNYAVFGEPQRARVRPDGDRPPSVCPCPEDA